ncbi:MAG: hypothetical protein R3286_19060, partial [Gammaproteobacteria bacterium]|nr:hypothetical protein [Gammaproteobacteria bacterium]
MSAMSRRRLWVGVAAVGGVLLAAVLACALVLGTHAGQTWLVRWAAAAASVAGEREVAVGALHGNLLGEFTLDRLAIRDAEGEWLRLEEARVRWRPRALLGGRLDVEALAVANLEVPRAPASAATGDEAGWPRLPVAVRVESLELSRLFLGEALAGEALALRVGGSSHVAASGAVETRLEVGPADAAATAAAGMVRIDATYDPGADRLRLAARVDELPAELVARASGLAVREPLSLVLDGDGALDDWRGRVRATLGEQASLEAEVELDARAARRLHVRVQGDLAGLLAAPA